MEPIRVVRISHSVLPRIGGQELHIHRLGLELARLGIDQHLFYLYGNPPTTESIKAHRIAPPSWLPDSHLTNALWLGKGTWLWIRALARKGWSPQIIHSHGDASDALIGGLLARSSGARAVHTIHGGLPSSPAYGLWAKACFGFTERIIAVSPQVVRQLQDWGVNKKKCIVISSGINLKAIETARPEEGWALAKKWGINPKDRVLLCVGRLSPVKGHRYLLEAASKLVETHPRLRVLIVGSGPLEPQLKAIARDKPWIAFTGELPPADVYKLYKIATMFVLTSVELPSQHEGSPTALMEAMAAGVPVVASATGGIQGLITDREDGLLVPPQDPSAIARTLEWALGQPRLLERLAGNAQKKVAQRDWRIVGKLILSIYHKLTITP